MSQEMYDIFARLNQVQASIKPEPKILKESADPAIAPSQNRVDEKYMGWKKTVAENKKGSKPDFLDLDKDGDKKEPMKKAAKEKKLQEAMCRECGMGESKCSCDKEMVEEAEKWIQKAIKKPGALHKQLGVPQDEKIPAAKLNKAAKAGGKLGQRARLAKTLKSFNEGDDMVDEMFFYDLPDTKKDRGPRDHGHDELERRSKLGKNPLVKHGKEYKDKGDNYKIAGPKGRLPEGEIEESGLMASIGRKKHGDKYMRDAALLMRNGGTQEELGRLRDKESKAYKKKKMDEADFDEGNLFGKTVADAKRDGIQKGEKISVGGKEYPLKEKLSPGEMKAFAALAEPKDKVTYADKIAGAKKRRPKMHEAEIEEESSSKGTAFDPDTAKKHSKDSKTTPSGRHDISKSKAGGTVYSKRFKDEEDEEETSKSSEKKTPGRRKKHTDDKPRQERVTAKSRKKDRTAHGQSGFKADKKKHVDEMGYGSLNYEDHMMGSDHGEYDQEGGMAKDQLHTIVKAAKELHGILGDEQNLPEWVQSKITKALDYINASRDYMDQEESDMDHEMIGEKAVSQQQQKFMGMVHSMQKGGQVKGASPELKKVARTMKKSDAEDFAATKHKGLPKRVKAGKPVGEDGGPGGIEAEKPYRDEKSGKMVQPPRGATNPPQDPVSPAKKPAKAPVSKRADADTTNDEQVAETDKNPTDTASKKSKGGGGMTFGKGIYDSMNRDLESMIAENMDINVSANSEGNKTLSVNARDEDAEALARLLMMAGIGGHSDGYDKVCPSCGSPECQCDMVDEAVSDNEPDYPENMAQGQDTDFMTQTIAGGLNRRKPDITTLPATMVRPMDESVESDLWQKLRTLKANQ